MFQIFVFLVIGKPFEMLDEDPKIFNDIEK